MLTLVLRRGHVNSRENMATAEYRRGHGTRHCEKVIGPAVHDGRVDSLAQKFYIIRVTVLAPREHIVSKKKSMDEPPVFEESLKELEQIVGKLESGKLGLEDSLEQYEQGVQHLKQCYQLLRSAERRVELVTSLDSTGKVQSDAFDVDDEESLTAKGEARGRRRSSPGKRGPNSEVDDPSSLF